MDLLMLGINFRTAPIEVRERVSFSAMAVPDILKRLSVALPGTELVLICTCNRTELYAAASGIAESATEVFEALRQCTRDPATDFRKYFYLKTGLDAARHLMAVGASLDSMVVGEDEILGQVKQAYLLAIEAETAGHVLHTLFQSTFTVAKRVRAETHINRGRVSVSSIAVEFAEKVFSNLRDKAVMIVGAGETAERVMKSLLDRGVEDVLVVNRSRQRCRALADRWGGRAVDFDELDAHLPHADIVMSSTSAPHCILRTESVRRASHKRQGQPMLLVDLAVPRDIEPEIAELSNVYLYDIDDLQRVAAENLARRRASIEAARRLVEEGAAELAGSFETADLKTIMRQLSQRAQQVQELEIESLFAKEAFDGVSDAARDAVRGLVQRTVNRMLDAPRRALKRASQEEDWDRYAGVVCDVFALEKETGKSQSESNPGSQPGRPREG